MVIYIGSRAFYHVLGCLLQLWQYVPQLSDLVRVGWAVKELEDLAAVTGNCTLMSLTLC